MLGVDLEQSCGSSLLFMVRMTLGFIGGTGILPCAAGVWKVLPPVVQTALLPTLCKEVKGTAPFSFAFSTVVLQSRGCVCRAAGRVILHETIAVPELERKQQICLQTWSCDQCIYFRSELPNFTYLFCQSLTGSLCPRYTRY